MAEPQRAEDVPFDRVTRLADAAVKGIEAHEEYHEGEDKAIILLDDSTRGGLVHQGYPEGKDGDMEVAMRLLEHARAIHELHGIPFSVHHLGQG